MFVTKRNCKRIAQEVVDNHYKDIITKLNIPDTKIQVKDAEDPFLLGRFEATYCSHIFDVFQLHGKYVHNESTVYIFALECLYTPMYLPFLKPVRVRSLYNIFKCNYKKTVLNALAHELRHTYQHFYHIKVDNKLSQLFTSYSKRPCEIDACVWSKEYMNSITKNGGETHVE